MLKFGRVDWGMLTVALMLFGASQGISQEWLPDVQQRFQADTEEVPDFQKHVVPLFGRLGCNGRACHGAFQGQGGFQLSLFGYDFDADHQALFSEESPRVDLEATENSLILFKPTDEDEHEGGERFTQDGWEYRLFSNWISAGAPKVEPIHKLQQLVVEPSQINFTQAGESLQLRVIAVWEDGVREDVTPLCRFRSNDSQLAVIDDQGQVTGGDPGATHVVVFYDKAVVPIPVLRAVSDRVGERFPEVPTPTPVDELVVAQLKQLGMVPSDLADDATFLRRIRLDLTGTLPTPQEIEQFLGDDREDKRAQKIDELLESPAYAAWWTTKLCDYTGNNSLQLNNTLPVRGQAEKDWYDWIYKRIDENVPYDELVAGIVTAKSIEPQQTYAEFSEELCSIYRGESDESYADLSGLTHFWTRRDFRDSESRAINFAYAFMGVRIQCAQCHKHPFDQWSKQDFDEFTKFFGSVVFDQTGRQTHAKEYTSLLEELDIDGSARGNQLRRQFGDLMKEGKTVPMPVVAVRPGIARPRNQGRNRNQQPQPKSIGILGQEEVSIEGVQDVREPLMAWLRREDNPYFARAFVNRVWASYFGVGIVEPADDLNLANPPSNAELLTYLERGFVDQGFDMKWLHREIANSRTYQLDWRTNDTNALDKRHFSHAYLKRMPAEVLCDAVVLSTANESGLKSFESDWQQRTIAAPGTQLQGAIRNRQFALEVFGRSTRESNCDCDRTEEATLLQTVYLQNDQDVYTLLKRPTGWISEVSGQSLAAQQQSRLAPFNKMPKAKQLAFIQNRMKQVAKQIQRAKQQENETQLKQLRRQQAQLKKRLEQVKMSDDVAAVDEDNEGRKQPVAKEVQQPDVNRLISQAYLRTLSRFPELDERTRCQAYFEDSETVAAGLEGLLWALINTKEFRVIH
jgi:hypothetical protein